MRHYTKYLLPARSNKRGNASLILLLVLLCGLTFYYLTASKSNKGLTSIDIETEGNYLDSNIIALDVVSKLRSQEISIDENASTEFKMNAYIVSVIRGSDMATEKGVYRSYLVETYKEDMPSDVYQYLFVGVPVGGSYSYYLLDKKNKAM